MADYADIIAKLSLIEKHELLNAAAYLHNPSVAPLYYKYVFCDPLNDEKISDFYKSCDFHITDQLKEFYRLWNGVSLNQSIDIFGSLANKGRQPISLEYGNLFERPIDLPDTSTVIGGKDLSYDNVGYLVSHENGLVTCTSSLLICDEIESWPDIAALIESEIK